MKKRTRFEAMEDDGEDLEYQLRRRGAPQGPYRPATTQETAHEQKTMPHLLSIPLELRQTIYEYLLESDRVDPPRAPLLGDHHRQGEIHYPKHYNSWKWPKAVWASRVLRDEIFDLARDRLLKRQSKAELDIMANGYVFAPTWLYLPPDLPGEVPFDLTVNLRIFSTEAFHSNDGWPRQPGSGFRTLLKLLNQLVHQGPSFGQHLELLAGKVTWPINNLHIKLSFHDAYTPATWRNASHTIFAMLKSLATSGLANGIVSTIQAESQYTVPRGDEDKVYWSRTYEVSPTLNMALVQQWRSMGFLKAFQRTLADDFRKDWEPAITYVPPTPAKSNATPGPASIAGSSASRRDSPVGLTLPVPNPQSDDYGLITPPTPLPGRRNLELPSSSRAKGPGTPGSVFEQYDDYSSFAVHTPGAVMNGLLDDYSSIMAPTPMADEYSD